jgi:hypothetical protein
MSNLLLVLALVACTTDTGTTTTSDATTSTGGVTTSSPPTTTIPTTPAGARLRPVAAFADFAANPLRTGPPYAGPTTPGALEGVLWADQVPAEAAARLEANGFAVVESQVRQFHEAYSNVDIYGRQPLFVTSDVAYHYWHLAFSKALRDTEQLVLLPVLEEFALRLEQRAEEQALLVEGTSLEAEGARILEYSRLLLAILELGDGPFSQEVQAELDLIRDHLDFDTSPTTGAGVDYSLFGTRGHYTRTPELTRYFLAMSSLGQTAFKINDPSQIRTGLMLARVITGDPGLADMWAQIYEPTAFLVGLADDFTPSEMAGVADQVDADWRDTLEIVDTAFLAEVGSGLRSLREVAIDPELASMRVMGARFVLDSFILDQLVFPNVKGEGDDMAAGRLEASPLDVAAAFGSDWAYQLQIEAGVADTYPDYEPQMDQMKALVGGRVAEDWAGTVYDGWLYAIQPMWSSHGDAYPDFMRTDPWSAKAHATGFGSYTELKHDTVLYAKQAFAEGDTPPVPVEPRHWVEPEPVVYARLAAVAGLMRDGLGDRGLLAPDVAEILERLTDLYGRFERLAIDELEGVSITEEDNQWLETIASRLELIWLLAGEDIDPSDAQTGGFAESPDDMAAVVVDIMSNPEAALELGTGHIDIMYVLVPNDEGVFQVARGGVYSYYEFWVPRGERLTDEEWRAMLVAGEQPDRPDWVDTYLVRQP